MSTCPPNLTHSFQIVCDIITFKIKQKVLIHCAWEGQQCFGGQKPIFGLRYGLLVFIFLFLFELGRCMQNLIFTKVVEGCQKNYFPQRGMLKFTYKGRFFIIKIAYEKNLRLKIQMAETCSSASCTRRSYFKVSLLGRFWQILALWVDFPTFKVAKSMPKLRLKSSKPHNFSIVSPIVTCNSLLESYHPYL